MNQLGVISAVAAAVISGASLLLAQAATFEALPVALACALWSLP